MLLLYYIMLSVLKSSTIFFMLYNCVIYNYDICDYPMIDIVLLLYFITCITIIHNIILYFLFKFKIKRSKNENQK